MRIMEGAEASQDKKKEEKPEGKCIATGPVS